MKLRHKIFLGFGIINLVLIVAGYLSIVEFNKLAGTAKKIMKDNYSSIEAGEVMQNSLEVKDRGLLLFLSGDTAEGSRLMNLSDSSFRSAYNYASKHISEKNEAETLTLIIERYNSISRVLEQVRISNEKEIKALVLLSYNPMQGELHAAINDFMELNRNSMFSKVASLSDRIYKINMPIIATIITVFLLTLMFTFIMNKLLLSPIQKIVSLIKPGALPPSIRYNPEATEVQIIENYIKHKIIVKE